jgi:hypothetical protein
MTVPLNNALQQARLASNEYPRKRLINGGAAGT